MPFIVQRLVGADQRVREIPGRSLRLGRGTGVDVRFDDPGIDYEHALIEDTDGGFVIRDLGSPGGTWVNGEQVEQALLKPGDRIDLGVHEAKVSVQGFGAVQYLYLAFEEIGADDSVMRSGLHSMTMSFASRELQDLARQARERYQRERQEATGRKESERGEARPPATEAPTGAMRTRPDEGPVRPEAADGRPAEEVSASHLLDLLTESGIDLRDSFADFDRELKQSIEERDSDADDLDTEGPTMPLRTVGATDATPESGAERDSPWSDLPLASVGERSAEPPPVDESTAIAPAAPGAPKATPQPVSAKVPSARSATAAPPDDEARTIDYLRAYGLPGGVGMAWSLALIILVLGLGSATAAAVRHTNLLSPGPLGGRHADAEGLTCASCHTGFLGVKETSCVACHGDVHDHQEVMADERGCISCHTEHRGGDALRLADPGACVSCHSSLSETQAAAGKFADRITTFAEDHPEFAVYVEPERRVRLDTAEARSSDPGGLKGFNHYWHMQKLPSRLLRECSDCHHQDEAGEIVPVDFERNCRECHQLAFDPRFPGAQTPHDTPTVVTGYLIGHYVEHREVLRRLTPAEQRLGGGSLSTEERLTRVAELVSARLLRTQCSTCHALSKSATSQGFVGAQVQRVQVKPVRITQRWFPHAEPFPHGKHVTLTNCSDCHALAPTSRDTSDLILPSQAACKTCHRPATDEETDPNRLASSTCRTCHSFHAGPVEVRSWSTSDPVATVAVP